MGTSLSLPSRSQAPAWERLSAKLCFAGGQEVVRYPVNDNNGVPQSIPQLYA